MPRARSVDRLLLAATLLTADARRGHGGLGLRRRSPASTTACPSSSSASASSSPCCSAWRDAAGRHLRAAGPAALRSQVALPLPRPHLGRAADPVLPAHGRRHAPLAAAPVGSFQPSALAKVTLPLALAAWIAHCRGRRETPARTFYPALAMLAVTAVLVLVEPDLGSAVLLLAAAVRRAACSPRSTWKPLLVARAAPAPVVVVAILAKPYRMERIRAFFGETSYQVQQSLIALGGGGAPRPRPGREPAEAVLPAPAAHRLHLRRASARSSGLLGGTDRPGTARDHRRARPAGRLPRPLAGRGAARRRRSR